MNNNNNKIQTLSSPDKTLEVLLPAARGALAQDVFWTTAELANRWRLRPTTIRFYAAYGFFPSFKIGGRYRIAGSAIHAFEAKVRVH